jgi:galactokinase
MLRPDAVAGFRQRVAGAYQREFRVAPVFYDCKPSSGAAEII